MKSFGERYPLRRSIDLHFILAAIGRDSTYERSLHEFINRMEVALWISEAQIFEKFKLVVLIEFTLLLGDIIIVFIDLALTWDLRIFWFSINLTLSVVCTLSCVVTSLFSQRSFIFNACPVLVVQISKYQSKHLPYNHPRKTENIIENNEHMYFRIRKLFVYGDKFCKISPEANDEGEYSLEKKRET